MLKLQLGQRYEMKECFFFCVLENHTSWYNFETEEIFRRENN